MKKSKQFKRIILISLVLVAFMAITRCSYASDFWDNWEAGGGKNIITGIAEGIIGYFTAGIQLFALGIFMALQALTAAITGISGTDGFAGTIGSVVFNKCSLTTANFFGTPDGAIAPIIASIGKYYAIIRALSIALLLGILLYTGIRMAISTVASEEAKYKKMFQNWLISLVLLFVLHYIIVLTFTLNDSLVSVLAKLDNTSGLDFAELMVESAVPGLGLPSLMVYGSFVIGTLAFVLMYIKRIIVLAFLIVISPLITVTYSIDKMGDGKSQALNTWLKEFIFTVIIQPFHCVIYLVFYSSVMGAMSGSILDATNLGKMVFAVASVFFMLNAEGIVKKIFGIQPSSMGSALGTGAMAISMATGMFKGKGKKVDSSKGKMPKMQGNSSVQTQKEKSAASQRNATGTDATVNWGNNDGSVGVDFEIENNNQNQGNSSQSGGTQQPDNTFDIGDLNNIDINESQQTYTVPNQNVEAQPQRTKNKKESKLGTGLKRTLKHATVDHFKKVYNPKNSFAKAATLAGFIAGGAVGEDMRTAVSTATAAYGVGKGVSEDLEYRSAERRLEKNQQVFAGAYEDYARAYRDEHGQDVSDQEIRAAAKRVYDSDGNNLKTEAERDLYAQMDKMSDSAEIMGYSNGFDYVNETMRQVDEGVLLPGDDYVPKFYERSTVRNTNNRRTRSNTNGNTNGNS